MQRLLFLLLLLMMLPLLAFSQQNDNWVLFNSGITMRWTANGIQFDSVFPYWPFTESSTNAAISNSNGQLLFYAGANTLWNNNFELMNGAPDTTYQASAFFTRINEPYILPQGNDTSIFYTYFSPIGFTSLLPSILLRYKVNPWYVNLWQANTGRVLSVDTLYNGPHLCADVINAVKHGNGRDYWIIFHPHDADTFITWLQNYDGTLSGPFFQKTGPIHSEYGWRFFKIIFNTQGTKMALINFFNVWVFDFDRCSGQLSNQTVIDTCATCFDDLHNGNYTGTVYLDACFSPEGNMLYVARYDSLIQFDLTNYPNSINRTVVWNNTSIPYPQSGFRTIGDLKLGKDNKIYVGTATYGIVGLDSGNTYLGVIKQPDLAGSSCDFDRYGIYCNGFKSAWLLPNYVNYDLGPWVGSPCDTLTTTSISEQSTKPKITLAPNPAQTQATLTWSGVREGTFVLRDMLGRAVLSEVLNAPGGTTRLDLSELPKGIYLWHVQSDGYTKNGKLVVE